MGEIERNIIFESAKWILETLLNATILTAAQRGEILDKFTNAITLTEGFYAQQGHRHIQRNQKLAEAWRSAGVTFRKYFPKMNEGVWLSTKAEAWANPGIVSEAELEENGMKLSDLRELLERINRTIIKN